ncbi:hypothetical protein [Phyllobacterium bourgognense]|uniref:Heat induced stress protein YflT n=1 Tax=Phyllobacterium bourgognense TaxID=314236 RepID=A0A368YL46_9HYPH|nr:hypothetical protein [Phyllobacterium bourgognense]RCW78874.1 hypothetical protein C7476_12160 [Phyllobacterium bourgognense]
MEEFAENSPMSRPSNTLTAFYEDRGAAEGAVERLVGAGIARDSIRLVEGNYDTESNPETASSDAHKGFWESLGDFFFPNEDRAAYSEGLRGAATLLPCLASAPILQILPSISSTTKAA